jgi:hypothetical protein
MPPSLACRFTVGELAVLRIVGDEVREHGHCARTLGEISARAGVCRTVAKNAVRAAAAMGLLTVQERRREGQVNLPNVLRVVSREWLQWLERKADRPHRSASKPIGVRNVAPTDKSRSFRRVEAEAGGLDLRPPRASRGGQERGEQNRR